MSISYNTSPDMARLNPGYVENLGISLSAGTFSICSASGVALGARNAAYVTIPSKVTPGIMKTYRVTANQTFVDHNGSSTIAGATFGVTMQNNTSYNLDMPFFIYAVANTAETSVSFMICRIPSISISPVAGKIGQSGSASTASTQGSFFALGSITAANYASSPCVCLGSIRMQSTSSAGGTTPPDWTVQTLSTTFDGIGNYFTNCAVPTGCFGAVAGSYLNAASGTIPTFSGLNFAYGFINMSTGATASSAQPGRLLYWIRVGFSSCTGAGIGTGNLNLYLPFSSYAGNLLGSAIILNNNYNCITWGTQELTSPTPPNNLQNLWYIAAPLSTSIPSTLSKLVTGNFTGVADRLEFSGTLQLDNE